MAWIFGGSKKKETPTTAEITISGPSSNSFQHKSHLAITEQGFEANNLPPEWNELFVGLSATLKQMGLKGITKKEAQFLLKAAAQHLPGLSPEARSALATIDNKEKGNKHEIVHMHSQTPQSLTINDEKETIFTRYKVLEEENKILKSEIAALRDEIRKAFQTVHSLQGAGATPTAKPQVPTAQVPTQPLPTQPLPTVPKDAPQPPIPPRDAPQQPPIPPRDGPPLPHHEVAKAHSKMPPLPPSGANLIPAKNAPASGPSALLDQIQKGKQLKPTEFQPKAAPAGDDNILSILAKVIIERRKATEGTDEEEDTEEMWA